MEARDELQLADYIRAIPDFPKPGVLFRDITPLLASPAAFRQAIEGIARWTAQQGPRLVAAVEARGFLLAAPLALEMQAGLVPIRKKGKLPYRTLAHTYDLEYGQDTLEIHEDAIPSGTPVVVVDDVLATGGTVQACCRLVEKAGGRVVGCAFLIELLALGGARKIAGYPHFSLLKFD